MTALVVKTDMSALIQPARYRNGNFFFGVNGADTAFVWGNYNSSLRAYQSCPVVSSIINKQALCSVNGIVKIMDKTNKESNGAAADAIRYLIQNPNPYQTGRNFRAQNQVYKRIYGYCPVLVIKKVGYEKDYTKWKLINLPPWMLRIEDDLSGYWYEENVRQFKSITLSYSGKTTPINPDNVYFITENQISTGLFMSNSNGENVSIHLPDSRLLPLKDNIINVTESLNARGALTRQRGPQWLLTNDANDNGDAGLFPLNPDVKKDLHDDFLRYGIMSGQRKAIITDAKLKLQTVGFDVSQLKLLEGEVQDAKFISDGLFFPPYLLGLVDAKFDNQQVAERNLYGNCIIPDAASDDEQWSQIFRLEGTGLRIFTDFSHLPVLQENLEQKARGRWYYNQALLIEWLQDGLTWNRWRELLGEDTVLGMDKYYSDLVKEGRILPAATAAVISTAANNVAPPATNGVASTNGVNNNSNNLN